MINTLRITSIIAVILAVILILLPAAFGFRKDEDVEQLLSSAGAVEKFKKEMGDKTLGNQNQVTPLVIQARKFADYLDPPAVKTKPPKRTVSKTPSAPTRAAVSSKFNLIGTSFYQLHPEQSLALVDQPGKGLRWVRQGNKVGHSTIEQVKDGLIIVKDGSGTYELTAQRKQRPSLLKSSSSSSGTDSLMTAIQSASKEKMPFGANADAAKQGDIDEFALMQMLVAELKTMQTDSQEVNLPGKNAEDAQIGEFIAQLEASRVTDKEAQQLDDLAKELEKSGAEPNQPAQEPNQVAEKKTKDSDKVVRPRRTRRSRRRR